MTRPGRFAPEFKVRAIDLYRSSEGRTIADVAHELGIGTETFRKWVGQDEADPERIMDGLGMCSPNEYEAAFYADTTNANLDPIVKVGNHQSSLQ